MRAAARVLTGAHDFESFRAAGCQAEHARRVMHDITIETIDRPPAGHLVQITYRADAYCRHMCRILTGTLVEVGRGQRTPQSMRDVLTARSRFAAGVTAPPQGLCLLEVRYCAAAASHLAFVRSMSLGCRRSRRSRAFAAHAKDRDEKITVPSPSRQTLRAQAQNRRQ